MLNFETYVALWNAPSVYNIFSVDYLLPVRIDKHTVGVVFRNGDATMILVDHYDITNKAILCNPAYDVKRLARFVNKFDRLRVVTEEELKRNEEELKRKESQDAPVTDSSPSSSSDTELPPLPPEMPHITQPTQPTQMVHMASNQYNNVNRYYVVWLLLFRRCHDHSCLLEVSERFLSTISLTNVKWQMSWSQCFLLFVSCACCQVHLNLVNSYLEIATFSGRHPSTFRNIFDFYSILTGFCNLLN